MIINYKWDNFAQSLQYRGFWAHLFYVCILILYIDRIYIQGDFDDKPILLVLMAVAIVYPTSFELFQ